MDRSEFCALLREKAVNCADAASSRKNECVFETGSRNFKMREMLFYLKGKGLALLVDSRKYLDERLIVEYFAFLKKSHNIKTSIVGAGQIEKGERKLTIDLFLLYCKELDCKIEISATSWGVYTRSSFGAMLKQRRQSLSLRLKDVSAQMSIGEGNVYRYEAGSNNYKVCECLRYIDAIKHVLYLDASPFKKNKNIADFLSSKREESGLIGFNHIVGLSRSVVFKTEKYATELTIDTLLAYCRVLDIKIEIRPKETVTLVGGNGTNINE